MFWGFSEAFDFYEVYKCHKENKSKTVLNILLFGSSDPRHVIKTLAKSYLHSVHINFYVIEGCPALIARHMTLTSIPLEPPTMISLLAKVHLFMDIYANTHLRISSMGYIDSKANHLIKCVTDSEFNEKMQPIFNLTNLKYIERDCLENIFSFWRENGSNYLDLQSLWKQRIEQYLGVRYDSREGAFDWDLNMRLKDYGGQQICMQEYRHWRETGIAFTFPEYRQTCSNRRFAIDRPERMNGSKFIGDVIVGPFCAFGLSCSDAKMLKSNYGQNQCRATDVSERNIFELFFEIEAKRPFDAVLFAERRLGAAILDLRNNVQYQSTQSHGKETKNFNEPLLPIDRMRIFYLSANDFRNLIDGKKYERFFDGVFVGRDYFKILKKEFSKVFAPNAMILFETLQLSAERKDKVGEFLQKVRCLASEMELKPISNFNINLPLSIAKFQMNDKSE